MSTATSSETKQASELEQAILSRAQALVEEQYAHARQATERITNDCNERLHLREEREVLIAKSEADRAYHRKVQASEIQLQAELDRLRWELVQDVMHKLRQRLAKLVEDENEYLPLLHKLLGQAANLIEKRELVVEVNTRDYQRLYKRWDSIVQLVAPEKKIHLKSVTSGPVCECVGGLMICSEDRRICVDNTFEGIIRRMENQLHQAILSRLFPSKEYMSLLFNG